MIPESFLASLFVVSHSEIILVLIFIPRIDFVPSFLKNLFCDFEESLLGHPSNLYSVILFTYGGSKSLSVAKCEVTGTSGQALMSSPSDSC